jgi:hypothetical protein
MKIRAEMSPQIEREFVVQLGKSYWQLLIFVENPISKDAYWIFPIPDVPLKLSIHLPKPPMHPNLHLHWKSEPLGIHEDVYDSPLSPEDWQVWAMELLENFKFHEPSSDENVTVFPLLTDAQRIETLGKRERTVVDVGRFMQTICNGTFYRTKVKRLPLLMREKPYGNMSVCAFSESGMIIPIDSETMIEIDPHSINVEKLMRSNFSSIFDPMEKAFATIQRISPNSFQRWFPSPRVEDFLEEITDPLKHSKPKIIDF